MRLLASALMVLAGAPAAAETVALTGIRLIDGRGGAPVEDATIVISDGRIVGAGRNVAVPDGARRIAHAGRTVIPGLITAHSHVGQVGGVEMGAKNYTREIITAELAQFGRYGVTTVVALGNNGPLFQGVRADAHAGKLDGADLFGVSQGIGVPNGAPPQAMMKVGPDQLFRPATAEEARQAVDRMAAAKTDLVKIWLDNFGGLLPVKMAPEVYRAVIDQSHRHGLRVAAHVHDLVDAEAIIDAGADIIAHGIRDKPVPPELIAKMKEKGVWYVATLALDDATFAWADQAPWTLTPFTQAALSPAVVERTDDAAWREKVLAEPRTAAARRSLAMNLRNLKTLHDAGVRIGFGTDSGATPLRVAGVAEHRELALMVEAGLTPADALIVATANTAKLLELSDRGTLEAGKRADLLVLEGDPLADIAASQRIVEVWTAGRQTAGPSEAAR
ncbi:amidohydrolase family protein [Hyphomicrobium sp.]|uniref:amidohydrolase family protein n=1 Tax=Hyphomicrobium sp. TaxID=82 RepID=UPI0025BDB34B|nr:amidohydrolase family protein [Hyphomicrobium sp.]MCC7253137.1 amidohydrolase family protein [Hyphomicrobium sp.]